MNTMPIRTTLFAGERPLVRVDGPMLLQTNRVTERLVANVAREQARAGVSASHVYLQAVG